MKAFLFSATFVFLCIVYSTASPPLALPYEDQWVWVRTERKAPEEKQYDVVDYEDMFFRGAPAVMQPKMFVRPCTKCPFCCRNYQLNNK
ncbi:hypothetical protein QR680_013742 [Steinernema hermaphroditum]|uniref:Uncharacterized protein n=1 Tax=Steinernema hermaphroditum TaxID=289476 RepID=A0AA39I6I2_9BILA|nr:hypothetical protein QR680_013742 [Steinernema hermaphroditum]